MIIIITLILILILFVLLKNWSRNIKARDQYWSNKIDQEITEDIDKFERSYSKMDNNRKIKINNQIENINGQERRENAGYAWRMKWGL